MSGLKRFHTKNKYRIKYLTLLFTTVFCISLTACSQKGLESVSQSLYDLLDKDGDELYTSSNDTDASGRDNAKDIPLVYSDNENSDGDNPNNLEGDTIGLIDDEERSLYEEDEKSDGIKVYNADGDLLDTEISVVDEEKLYSDSEEVLARDIVLKLGQSSDEHNNCYAYSQLDDKTKNTYVEVYSVLMTMKDNVILTSKDAKEIDLAFRAVMVDHPDIFYAKGYSLGKYMYGTTVDKISISGKYIMAKGDVVEKKEKIENYITKVIHNAPLDDDYEKIKYVYEYLVLNNVYEEGAPNNQNILSVVENGRTVCQGYAKMTQLLLNRMGIFCTLVNGYAAGSNGVYNGDVSEKGRHVWNIVKCNGKYYHVDTTWGDAAFTLIDENEVNSQKIDINYEFLLVDDNELRETHVAEPVVPMPRCDSKIDNYYVREGIYFTSIDDGQLKRAFENAYSDGKNIIFLKESSESVYDGLKKYLLEDQHIFDYLYQNNIKYVEYRDRRLLLFSL